MTVDLALRTLAAYRAAAQARQEANERAHTPAEADHHRTH